jgi:hypothetical protein
MTVLLSSHTGSQKSWSELANVPKVDRGSIEMQASFSECLAVARNFAKLVPLAMSAVATPEQRDSIRALADELAPFGTTIRGRLQKHIAHLALRNAEIVRADGCEESRERLLSKGRQLEAIVDALKEHIPGWNISNGHTLLLAFHINHLKESAKSYHAF